MKKLAPAGCCQCCRSGVSPLMTTVPTAPNNLGATLLIALGFSLLPLLFGIPIVLYGLSLLRTREGQRTYQHLLPGSR